MKGQQLTQKQKTKHGIKKRSLKFIYILYATTNHFTEITHSKSYQTIAVKLNAVEIDTKKIEKAK